MSNHYFADITRWRYSLEMRVPVVDVLHCSSMFFILILFIHELSDFLVDMTLFTNL